jgi:two-component system, LytTR family, response regulator
MMRHRPSFSTLLIDDEKRAIALLRKLLEETGVFTDIRWAFSAETGLEAVKKKTPDIIFLDIKMPNRDGFSFLADLKNLKIQTEIIFVTAYDQYVLQAIKHHAFDYLMKPVVREELEACIKEFKEKQGKHDFSSRLGHFLEDYETHKKIRFNTRTGFFQLEADAILYCLADGNYTQIFTSDGGQMCTLNIGHVHELLPTNGFVRLGRSIIINTHYVFKVDRKSGDVTFEKGGKQIPLNIPLRQIKELDKLI